MFISQTTTRRTANKTYRSVRLVESRRVGRKVQQKTLLNLGANFAIPKVQWAELVEIIEARLAGNEFLFEPAPELTTTAEAIVQKLRSREMVQAADEALMGDTANVQLDSLEMDNGRSVGCERLALEVRESLRFSEALKNVGMSDRDARLTMAMVIARMVHPSSERAALNWLETNSATLELLRLDTGKGLKLDKLYRLSDVLVKHHRTIEPKFSSWSLIPASFGRFFTQYQSVKGRLFTQGASPNGLAIVELTRQSYCFNIKNLTELRLAPTAEFRLKTPCLPANPRVFPCLALFPDLTPSRGI